MFRLSFCLLSLVLSSILVLGQGEVAPPPVENAPAAANSQPPTIPIILLAKPKSPVVKPEVITPTHETPKEKVVPAAGPATVQPVAPTELITETVSTNDKPTEAPTTVPITDSPTPPPTPPPTPKPTPAPAPKPVPAPQQGKWFYTDSNNVTCIIVQFAAQLNVTYTNTSSALAYALLNVPANATVSGGSCGATEQWLVLSWPTVAGEGTNNMTLRFNGSSDDYQLLGLNVSVATEDLPDAQDQSPLQLWHGPEWRTPLRTSYRCAAPAPLALAAPARNAAASLALAQLQEEAFRSAASHQFSSPRDCGGGDVSDAVPIAVGCALAGLVVVMLGAYLIGRRRSAAHGYLSM